MDKLACVASVLPSGQNSVVAATIEGNNKKCLSQDVHLAADGSEALIVAVLERSDQVCLTACKVQMTGAQGRPSKKARGSRIIGEGPFRLRDSTM